MNGQEITLRVPGQREYALVLRTALGGVAMLKDLDTGALDDLRNASDEAVDCLLHQGRNVQWLTLTVQDGGDTLNVCLCADFCGTADKQADPEENDVSRAVLETLIPQVDLVSTPCGCVSSIKMTLLRTAI